MSDNYVLDGNGDIVWNEMYTEFEEGDIISHPNHYMMNGMETKDIIEACVKDPESAYQANVIKYITRYPHKGTPIQDLEKAKQYIDFIIELRRTNGN